MFAFHLQNWNLRNVSKNHWLWSLWQHVYYSYLNICEHLWSSKKLTINCKKKKGKKKKEQNVCTVLFESLGADSEFVLLTARWQQWGYRSCPQKWDFWIIRQKLDKYAFAIIAHFAAKSYNFWIHKVKFNKVKGIMVCPERSNKTLWKLDGFLKFKDIVKLARIHSESCKYFYFLR